MQYTPAMNRSSVALLLLTIALAPVSSPATAAAAPAREMHFSKLSRTYTDLVSELAPIQQGPLTVRLSSPNHVLVVKDTRLMLTPATAGVHTAHLEIDLSGKGWLVGDVEAAGMATRLQDELYVMPQTVALDGKVRLRRVPSGYEVEPLELPKEVAVLIQSKLTNDLLRWCEGISIFSGFDCGGLEQSLTRIAVPMPATAGDKYHLPDAELTPDERALLDSFLPAPVPAAGR